ncbi:MAG TPA: phytoene/squalene synthase family protein [Candidatus Nanoarchaeia archaeon]|nr:phytoene/squalene synthase family protein [Candidatus Nanoarchaeia archaeon]
MDFNKSIIKKYGVGYYKSTLLLPKKTRHAVWALYAFVRLPDEIVDNPSNDTEQRFAAWQQDWKQISSGTTFQHTNQTIVDFLEVMKRYKIPEQYPNDFLTAMRQDLTKERYATYKELEQYMHGSATVVGYMMCHIIGHKNGALPYARALAEAFQMTNFLRDIQSDFRERKRIYIPEEDMKRFGVTEAHISQGIKDDAWKSLLAFEINRTRDLYSKGISGIGYLDAHGRKAVYASALIYKEILDKIEQADYDIFSKRIVVSPLKKTMLLCKALWYKNQ